MINDPSFSMLFNNMREGCCIHRIVCDESGTPVDILHLKANPAYGEHIGKKPEEVVGRTVRELYPDVDPSWIDRYGKVALTGIPERFEGRFGPLGRWYDVSAYQTEPEHFALIFSDITDRKERESQLTQAKLTAECANRAKSAFLANMSHEMRTPLHQIVALSQLIGRAPLNDKQQRQLEMLETAGRRMTAILEGMLKLADLEAKTLSTNPQAIDIREVAAKVLKLTAPRADDKRLTLSCEFDALPAGQLLGDAGLLETGLLCYLNNAITYTTTGSVTLRIARQDEDDGGLLLRFSVQDTGSGIPPEAIARLFSIFEQVDNSSTRKYGGTGIGLAMTRKLAELMGGEAGCDSVLGTGSTFWFTARLGKLAPQAI